MKEELKLYMLFFAFILFALTGCKDGLNNEDELADLTFLEYSLSSSCRWGQFSYNKVVVIHNKEELIKCIECKENIPDIDFSAHSLILAGGETNSGIQNVEGTMLKANKNKIVVEVAISLGITAGIDNWSVAYLTPKLSETKVDLNVTIQEKK